MDLDKSTLDAPAGLHAREGAGSRVSASPDHSARLKWLGVLTVIVFGGYFWWRHAASPPPLKIIPPIPVEGVVARRGDLKIFVSQIGTVTPFATVTLKSRVAGQIMKLGFQEGQIVNAGQPLFYIDPRPYQATLDQYRGQLARDQATLVNARITLARDEKLFREGVIAQQDLDNQRATYEQAIGTVADDRGLIEAAQVNLDYCKVTAPIAGRIGLREVDLGNYVATTDSLAVITQLQPISVIFSLPEDNIAAVARDMSANRTVAVEAWNRDFSRKLADGFLLTFDNQVDQATGTVKLRAQFANTDYSLFPSEFVNARLLLDTLQNQVLVPTAAIQNSQKAAYVYVVSPDHTVARRQVTIRAQQNETVALASGVQPGEIVVTDGLDKLSPGSRVNLQVQQVATPTDQPAS
ncbi:MAG TPA: efflux RND transporter periplasmic adaptor subunit [Candidatus Binataceae bacterium]|nr:efflux RND transporter periplasmic adaptor subunit [Candidatus Binataceae bacterium]